MVNDLIGALFYIFGKLLDFMFSSYILPGVSLGMLCIVSFMFTIMLNFLVAVPVMPKERKRGGSYGQKGSSGSNSSNSNS